MRLAIFGANGPVGLVLTRQALDEGHEVTAVTRRASTFPITAAARLTVQQGDVFSRDDVGRAIANKDAVLSTFGVPYTFRPVTVYSKGIANIIAAMKEAGVRRIIAVTSGGTRPGLNWEEGVFFSLVLKAFIGKTLYADQREMEATLSATDLDWTIARPARLIDTSAVTSYRVAEGWMANGLSTTSRLDLADFMLKQASSGEYVRKAVAVGTAT